MKIIVKKQVSCWSLWPTSALPCFPDYSHELIDNSHIGSYVRTYACLKLVEMLNFGGQLNG
jgi:hypothetical protein